jgi:predicted HAD superfamily phosphohydrolase
VAERKSAVNWPVQLNTDCEGPITLDDNAFDLAAHFIPHGEIFFARVSAYDDYLTEVEKRPGYKAGDTLKLIIPFLLAFGASKERVIEFSSKHLTILPEAQTGLAWLSQSGQVFMVSTSYSQYAQLVAERVRIKKENVYATVVDWDNFTLSTEEATALKKWATEIVNLSPIEISLGTSEFSQLSKDSQKTVKRLERIFWQQLKGFQCFEIFEKVNPIGGKEKAQAVLDSLKRTGLELEQVAYVGDSITDAEALALVKKNGGLAVAFNPNRYALAQADLAILSLSAAAWLSLVYLFFQRGKAETLEKAQAGLLGEIDLPENLRNSFLKAGFKVFNLHQEKWENLVEECEGFRQEIRGKVTGSLG